MARKPRTAKAAPLDTGKFENVHQVGGIQTGVLDYPGVGGGAAQSCRVAWVNTGSPLRFVVALDRGGDIVQASFAQHSLCFLTANGYKPASHAYHREEDWLTGWPGGLLTTCGPVYIGAARTEDGQKVTLHGHYSNTPAAVEAVLNPDPHRSRQDMLLSMVIRDTRMYGPHIECRRQIHCRLGQPALTLLDTVTNRGDETVAHNWLYHVNTGYPLLDQAARFIYRGKLTGGWDALLPANRPRSRAYLADLKRVPGALADHHGANSRGILIDPVADRAGVCRVGLINEALGLGLELSYRLAQLPRLANWQHYGPAGCFVSGLEPFFGSLMGKDADDHPQAATSLEPGESRDYELTLRVLCGKDELAGLAKYDGSVLPR